MVEFETSQLALQESQGVPVRRRGLGIADQIGFATKTSAGVGVASAGGCPGVGDRDARHARSAWPRGGCRERGVRAAITETRCLTREDRGRVDAELAPVVESMSVPGDHARRCGGG